MREFKAKVEGGKIPDVMSRAIGSLIRQLNTKTIIITIKQHHPKRSLNQNDYWHGVLRKHVLPIFKVINEKWTVERLHDTTLKMLGYVEIIEWPDGSTEEVRMESKNFTKPQWEEFMQRARVLYAESGIYIPLPNEALEGTYD